jgi:hypothetical protein
MERLRGALRVAALAALAACAASPGARDAGEPVTVDDLAPLPAVVTPANARQVVRQVLQRHAQAASDVHRRCAYRFGERGFVQLRYTPATDRGDPARAERVVVDYAAVEAVACATRTDLLAFRNVARVSLRGAFRAWAGWVTPLRPSPDPGAEPEMRERDSLDLDYPAAESEAARRLVEALQLLRLQPPDSKQEAP